MCTSPLTGFQPIGGGPLVFGKEPPNHRERTIPCGQCMECLLNRSRQWGIRCTHEAQLHERNCFVTLTYDEKHLPIYGSLHKPHLTDFWKRLRHHKGPFRYYACGEYGERTERAHYHACLFGMDFDDKKPLRKLREYMLYESAQLTDIWGHGHASIGELNFQTAAYTARYCTKKLSKGQARYVRLDTDTGEIIPLVQPFAVMSLRPAIAATWVRQFHGDLYSNDKDSCHINGKEVKPPKYYDKLYDKIDAEHMAVIKSQREQSRKIDTEPELRARAKITRARLLAKTKI